MSRPVITMITDFGLRDGYVGIMKGVIAEINPEVSVIDISHSVAAQDISEASMILSVSYRYFPKGTIHLVVTDPGVGSSRRPIVVDTGDYIFIGPDNGIFSCIYDLEKSLRVVEINRHDLFLPVVSNTFHGRDIFAPSAAYISKGYLPSVMGTEINDYVKIASPRPHIGENVMRSEVVYVDSFGNLITGITNDQFMEFTGSENFDLEIMGKKISGLSKTYAEAEKGALLALPGSSGRIEIAANQGNASDMLGAEKGNIVEVRRGKGRKISFKLNVALFLITLLTTLFAGAFQQGVDPFMSPSMLYTGIPFSFTLMAILLVHEGGHFLFSRHHHVNASLPYFIPAPTPIGTLGAVISMKELPRSRNAILDIGISGPLAGFIVSILAYAVGLYLPSGASELTLSPASQSILSRILMTFIEGEIPANASIPVHPIGYAGWLGLFITSLNLLPIGQLDGGHISYALFGDRHRFLARFAVIVLVILGFQAWSGWLVWALLVMFMGVQHPRAVDHLTPLDARRFVLGLIAFLIFVLTFTPTPFAS